jgi:hypothetical protein
MEQDIFQQVNIIWYEFNLISALYIMTIYDIMAIYPTLTAGTLLE